MTKFLKKPKNASIALISLLVISSFTLLLMLMASENSISTSYQYLNNTSSQTSYYAAEACLDEAILQLESDYDYTEGSITFDSDLECTISVADGTIPVSTPLFAGYDLRINGSDITVPGGHANDNVVINGDYITATDTITYVDNDSISGSNIDVTVEEVAEEQEMPSLPEEIDTYYSAAITAGTFFDDDITLTNTGDDILVNDSITIPNGSTIYVDDETVTINEDGFNAILTIVNIGGRINVNASNVTLTPAYGDLLMYTSDSKIDINGSNLSIGGVIATGYQLEINGSDGSFMEGYLWADHDLTINGNGFEIQSLAGIGSGSSGNRLKIISITVEYSDYVQNYQGTLLLRVEGTVNNGSLANWEEVAS